MALLPFDTVNKSADVAVLRVDLGHDKRSGRAEGVGGLCPPPLLVSVGAGLPFACAHVVTGCVAENVVQCLFFGHVAGALADDRHKFGLTDHEAGVLRQANRFAGADDGVGVLVERLRAGGSICAQQVGTVVQGQAEHLARFRVRGKDLDAVELVLRAGLFVALANWRVGNFLDGVAIDDAVRSAAVLGKSNEFHLVLLLPVADVLQRAGLRRTLHPRDFRPPGQSG